MVAAGNIIAGEPAVAVIQVYPQQFIYKNGEVIHSAVMDGGPNAQSTMLPILKASKMKRQERKGLFQIPYLVISERYQGMICLRLFVVLLQYMARFMWKRMLMVIHIHLAPVHLKLRITQMPVFNDKAKMPAY